MTELFHYIIKNVTEYKKNGYNYWALKYPTIFLHFLYLHFDHKAVFCRMSILLSSVFIYYV